jgi:hypothetical protein
MEIRASGLALSHDDTLTTKVDAAMANSTYKVDLGVEEMVLALRLSWK